MKSIHLISLNWFVYGLTFLTCISHQIFGEPEKINIRDAPTNESMIIQLRKAHAESSQKPATAGVESQDASKMGKPDDLLEHSIVLSYRGAAALVPKGAIIVYSEKYKSRLQRSPGDKLGEFIDFVAENRSWLSTHEVSFLQAQGKVPLDAKAKAQMTKAGNVVVATFRGNPIQILPPVATDVIPTDNQSQTKKTSP